MPEPLRIAAENGVLPLWLFCHEVCLYDVDSSRIRRRREAYRPVGANHQTIRSERCEGNVEEWNDLRGLPMLPISFGYQAREFAEYVGEVGEARDPLGPGIEFAVFDGRLGQMIEDEALAGEALDKFSSDGKMFGVNQNVIGEIELLERGNAAEKLWPQKEAIIGLALRDVAN